MWLSSDENINFGKRIHYNTVRVAHKYESYHRTESINERSHFSDPPLLPMLDLFRPFTLWGSRTASDWLISGNCKVLNGPGLNSLHSEILIFAQIQTKWLNSTTFPSLVTISSKRFGINNLFKNHKILQK